MLEVERYESLDQIARGSEAVVLGRITELLPGRVFGGDGDLVMYAAATVEVESVLGGGLVDAGASSLVLELLVPDRGGAAEVAGMAEDLPSAQAIFFLRNKGSEAGALGYPANVVASEAPFYRLVIARAVLADNGGRVDAPAWSEEPDFLTDLEGRPFDEVVETVRRAAG